jgi:diguanylate cyclase (GGDEF)-like protein
MKIDETRAAPGLDVMQARIEPVLSEDRSGAATRAADPHPIAGVPEADRTPRVRVALSQLMAEIGALRRQLRHALARVEELEHLADQDALLPMHNRRAFIRELDRTIAFAKRHGGTASLIYFDLNGLKRINDQHGHAAGDAALRRAAEILTENIRGTDVVGRIGGDEFAVILVQADAAQAAEKAAHLAQAIAAETLALEDRNIRISVACGVAETAEEALARADRAMYAHKTGPEPRRTVRQ